MIYIGISRDDDIFHKAKLSNRVLLIAQYSVRVLDYKSLTTERQRASRETLSGVVWQMSRAVSCAFAPSGERLMAGRKEKNSRD